MISVAFACLAGVLFVLLLIERVRRNGQAELTLVVIGRALQALNVRGVPRAKAIDLIAPEMRGALEKQRRRAPHRTIL